MTGKWECRLPEGEDRPGFIIVTYQGWTGPENAFDLTEKYINTIEAAIADGKARGFL